jgi:aldose 1-epimerase
MRPHDGWLGILFIMSAHVAMAGTLSSELDSVSGFHVYTLTQGDTCVRVVPDAGFNAYSIRYQGRELLRTPATLNDLPGFMYGVPLLYPTPNRVRAGKLRLAEQTITYTPNNGPNFLHGLVHSVPFLVGDTSTSATEVTLSGYLIFGPGTSWHAGFPIEHTLKVTLTVRDHAVRWTYDVDNTAGSRAVPFGFGLHPWFLDQSPRTDVKLTVPATHWMEAKELLPTGRLVDLAGTRYDLRQGKMLEGVMLDDVYFGMTPEHPARIDYLKEKFSITLKASPEFTHMVVFTEQPGHFCVENQTCSTDAHNLHAAGQKEPAHLLEAQPGESATGWVEFQLGPIQP